MRKTGVAEYTKTPGNLGVWMLRRDRGESTEFLMFTLWESLDAVRAFAGSDYEAAVFYPEDERFLVERDLRATHYEVDLTEPGPDERLVRLRGERVELRPLQVDDVARVAEIQAEPGVARWWGPPDEVALRQKAEATSEEKGFAIEVDGELMGLIEFHEETEPDFRHAGIDLFLTAGAQGQGLGPDAIRTLASYLFDQRGHHRLTIDPAADNTAAIRAFERVGFRAVGVMREYWRAPDGTWRDGLLMDLLAGELDPLGEAARPGTDA